MTEEQARGPGLERPMTDSERHVIHAEIAMARFNGPDNPPTGEVDSYGVQLRKRGYFEIANEVTDEEVLAHWMASGSRAVNLHGHRFNTMKEATMETNNKLREALVTLVDLVEAWKDHLPPAIRDGEVSKAIEKAETALAEPVKNCEVGTPEKQEMRFGEYCDSKYNLNDKEECQNCPLFKHRTSCEFAWAQMPYEEGGAR